MDSLPPEPNLSRRFDPKSLAAAANEIKTPLGIIALVVLVSASVLAVQTVHGSSETGNLLTAGAILVLVLALAGGIAIALTANRPPGPSAAPPLRPLGRQKTFMSAPMASLTGENYSRMKEKMRTIKDALKRDAGQADVFWGGDSVDDPAHWDRPAEALRLTIERIRDCDNFVLVLPDYACAPHAEGFCKPSSIWWEAGIAVAFGKRCTFFVHDRLGTAERMPYYLRAMQTAKGDGIPASKLWPFTDVQDIQRLIREAQDSIFDKNADN
jgi:hypothetical protein